ncbi:recombinase RecT [Amedibacillus sp. YH-ame6]
MPTTNQQGALSKTINPSVAKKEPKTIKDYIAVMMPEIEKALPKVMTPERFTRICLSAVSNTPKLSSCTPASFLGAMMNAAQLGLEPNTPLGQAYLIPYGNTCQFQLGYKGIIDLAYRSGDVKTIMAQAVYENDEFTFEFGLNPVLKHIPAKKDRGEPIWYYAVFKLVNGGEGFEVMSKDDVLKHAKSFSKTFSNGPWQTNFDEMAKKTVIKKVLKYAPMRTEFMHQINEDETVKTNLSDDMSSIPNEFFDAEFEESTDIKYDAKTGEVKTDLDGNATLL